MKTIPRIDILSSEFKADPFPFFARLRDEAPLWSIVVPDKTRVWLLSRYEDVFALFSDERFLKNRYSAMTPEQLRRQPWVPPMFKPIELNMLDLEPPHYCPGAPLARLEAQVAINRLLARAPDLRLKTRPHSLRWRQGLILRGLEALPVTLQS